MLGAPRASDMVEQEREDVSKHEENHDLGAAGIVPTYRPIGLREGTPAQVEDDRRDYLRLGRRFRTFQAPRRMRSGGCSTDAAACIASVTYSSSCMYHLLHSCHPFTVRSCSQAASDMRGLPNTYGLGRAQACLLFASHGFTSYVPLSCLRSNVYWTIADCRQHFLKDNLRLEDCGLSGDRRGVDQYTSVPPI